jgi:hypothetical protein
MSNIEKAALSAEEMEAILGEPVAIAKGRNALLPEVNALLVADAFKSNFMGKDVDMAAMRGTLMNSMGAVRDGDLDSMEAMLVGQATALQPSLPVWRFARQIKTVCRNTRRIWRWP